MVGRKSASDYASEPFGTVTVAWTPTISTTTVQFNSRQCTRLLALQLWMVFKCDKSFTAGGKTREKQSFKATFSESANDIQ